MRYAELAVNVPVNKTFFYHLPDSLEGEIAVGQLVRVAFGTAMQPGIVVTLRDDCPIAQTKPVIELLDPVPVVRDREIALAQWISETYLAPLGQCLWLMLPLGMTGQRDVLVTLVDASHPVDDPLQRKIIDLLKRRGALRGEQIRNSVKSKSWEIAVRRLADKGIVTQVPVLATPKIKPKVVDVAGLAISPDQIQAVRRYLGKPTRESQALERIVTLSDDSDSPITVQEVLDLPHIGEATLDRLVHAGVIQIRDGVHIRLVDDIDRALFDLRNGAVEQHVLQVLARENKPVDVSWIYAQTGASRENLNRLEEQGFVQLGQRRAWRDPLADRMFVPASALRLALGQRTVWRQVSDAIDHRTSAVFLLHGVTGSGKTEIYLRAIESTLEQGRQAIFLVPEIALTAQTVRRVMARFPGKVAVVGEDTGDDADSEAVGRLALVHGQLKPGERYDTWQRARAGGIDIVIGTRSALFTPLPDVGLVILDEEHDASYKQSPPTLRAQVYYHARDVAEHMMRANNGVLLLGSATPSVETYFRAQRGEITYLRLPDRIMGHRLRITEQANREGVETRYAPDESGDGSEALTIPLPPVDIVDMREELKAGNTGMFSHALQAALAKTLARREQAILFLNRRGTSTYVFCRDCGYVAICPRCQLPVTYHTQGARLCCHHCNYNAEPPVACPKCHSMRIKFFGAGTQQVEAALKAHFPGAVGLRWDSDTTQSPDAHDVILQRFINRQADVLIGTQMVAKGLDLPLVTLVGVVSADVGLFLPDFRAGERAFQVLAQVAGRAGRGVLGGKVVLQTYHPEHYAIVAAASHDYAGFYVREIAYRREIGYPPFRRLVRVLFRDENEIRAGEEAQRITNMLRERIQRLGLTGTEVIGPAPCFFSRLNRVYRWHVLLRGIDPASAFRAHPEVGLDALEVLRGGYIEIDPVSVL